MTLTPSGSPMGRSISGRNMPLLPTSIHLPSSSLRAATPLLQIKC